MAMPLLIFDFILQAYTCIYLEIIILSIPFCCIIVMILFQTLTVRQLLHPSSWQYRMVWGLTLTDFGPTRVR